MNLDYCDLLTAAMLDNNLPEHYPNEQDILDIELFVMDCLAIKHAGGEHLVHWDICEDYQ